MRNSFKPFILAATLGFGFVLSAASASAITIDGNLSDWGVTVADGNNSNFSSPSATIGLVSAFTEDQNDFAGDSGYVGPNYGGQNTTRNSWASRCRATSCISPSSPASARITG